MSIIHLYVDRKGRLSVVFSQRHEAVFDRVTIPPFVKGNLYYRMHAWA